MEPPPPPPSVSSWLPWPPVFLDLQYELERAAKLRVVGEKQRQCGARRRYRVSSATAEMYPELRALHTDGRDGSLLFVSLGSGPRQPAVLENPRAHKAIHVCRGLAALTLLIPYTTPVLCLVWEVVYKEARSRHNSIANVSGDGFRTRAGLRRYRDVEGHEA
ncbi:hypothetical protein LY78DRAFT_282090 [Colletotrichum sublineola]|nr:hypothetical protein LY78DRAFT_282090 [Colletotrichum sublineola]